MTHLRIRQVTLSISIGDSGALTGTQKSNLISAANTELSIFHTRATVVSQVSTGWKHVYPIWKKAAKSLDLSDKQLKKPSIGESKSVITSGAGGRIYVYYHW